MSPRGSNRGFTLIELMIVVVIATILLGIAVPSYMSQIRKSRRTEAKTALLDLATREERYFSTNGAAYSANAGFMGYTGWNIPVGSGYYTLAAPVVCPGGAGCAAGAPPSYTLQAVPVAGTSQQGDTTCQSFTVSSTGQQQAFDSANADQTPICWGQ
jgi:type IV pilus assembly protein PilE